MEVSKTFAIYGVFFFATISFDRLQLDVATNLLFSSSTENIKWQNHFTHPHPAEMDVKPDKDIRSLKNYDCFYIFLAGWKHT